MSALDPTSWSRASSTGGIQDIVVCRPVDVFDRDVEGRDRNPALRGKAEPDPGHYQEGNKAKLVASLNLSRSRRRAGADVLDF